MFAVRGIAISFSIFVMLYTTLSLLVCGFWRRAWFAVRQYPARHCADLLFTLRLLPFGIAAGVTLALAVPSFLMLEPRTANESMGAVPLSLSLCGIAVLVMGLCKAAAALVRASRTVARWSRQGHLIGSRRLGLRKSVVVLRISEDAPPLTAAGIFRSSVWLSQAAELSLTEPELQSALRHEIVHVRRRDNLRKLMLLLVAFPGMAELETEWREATEMAADDAAVSSASEALDLAAALIKLSRVGPLIPSAELATSLVHSPAGSISVRVQRLIAWTARPHHPASRYSLGVALGLAATMFAMLCLTYSGLLMQVHAATEWLVR